MVERLGKLHAIKEAGWFIAIPVVDQIRYRIDMREKALSINPQAAITKDNVHVQVSGNLYCQFVDAEKAAYGRHHIYTRIHTYIHTYIQYMHAYSIKITV